jgi:hypothetical protein
MRDFFLLQTISNTGNNWGNLPLYNEENKVLKGLTMKTLVIATIVASVTATASFAQQTPNNYIGTDNNGVISERVGNDANNVITRDMATQAELNRVDQEDHRVVNASVNSDGKLVLHSQDMDGGSKRNLTTTAQITGQDGADGQDGATGQTGATGDTGQTGATGRTGADGKKGTNGTNGKDGKNGKNGKNAIAPLGSLSFAAASASFSGNGIGFGLSASNYSPVEGSIVVGVDLGNNWRAVAGVTTDFNKRHAASVGVGVSF